MDDSARAYYREFADRLVDAAITQARANGDDISAESIMRNLPWDSAELDYMIAAKVTEITYR